MPLLGAFGVRCYRVLEKRNLVLGSLHVKLQNPEFVFTLRVVKINEQGDLLFYIGRFLQSLEVVNVQVRQRVV